jgi:hypothetical protein
MKFEVYSDESRPDLLSSQHPPVQYLVIGSLWLRAEDRQDFKDTIHALRDKHKIGGEFKGQKVSPSRLDFYRELVEDQKYIYDRYPHKGPQKNMFPSFGGLPGYQDRL